MPTEKTQGPSWDRFVTSEGVKIAKRILLTSRKSPSKMDEEHFEKLTNEEYESDMFE